MEIIIEEEEEEEIIYGAPYHRSPEQICGQRQFSYTPNCTAAERNWRRQLHSSCRPDSRCSSEDDDELMLNVLKCQLTY